MSIHYRVPVEADVQSLAALHVRCWQQAYDGIVDADYLRSLSIEQRAAGWARTLADREVFKLIACAGDSPIGFVSAGPAREAQYGDGEIYALYLDAACHGQGIGLKLCRAAVEDWRNRGGKTVVVNVLADNKRALRFYRLFGFHAVGEAEWKSQAFTLPEKILRLVLNGADQQ